MRWFLAFLVILSLVWVWAWMDLANYGLTVKYLQRQPYVFWSGIAVFVVWAFLSLSWVTRHIDEDKRL